MGSFESKTMTKFAYNFFFQTWVWMRKVTRFRPFKLCLQWKA